MIKNKIKIKSSSSLKFLSTKAKQTNIIIIAVKEDLL